MSGTQTSTFEIEHPFKDLIAALVPLLLSKNRAAYAVAEALGAARGRIDEIVARHKDPALHLEYYLAGLDWELYEDRVTWVAWAADLTGDYRSSPRGLRATIERWLLEQRQLSEEWYLWAEGLVGGTGGAASTDELRAEISRRARP